MMWVDDEVKKMAGRKLLSVELSGDKETVLFTCQDGFALRLGVEGDCCSRSWIEHLETFPGMVGATFLRLEEDYMPTPEGTDLEKFDVLKVYASRFITDRGEIVLEHRNDSNGYYGGSLYVCSST